MIKRGSKTQALIYSGHKCSYKYSQPMTLYILIVTEGKFHFDQTPSSLSTMIRVLICNHHWWVNFNVTCAHRDAVPPVKNWSKVFGNRFSKYISGTLKPNFTFTEENLKFNDGDQKRYYDSIFCFGQSNPGKPLDQTETEAIWNFMHAGNGVFACGDHSNHGKNFICSIPRVRHMFHFNYKDELPDNNRNPNNTIEPNSFSDPLVGPSEKDNVINIVSVRKYQSYHLTDPLASVDKGSPLVVRRLELPHPLLSTPREVGMVDMLPDHAHEGEIVEPNKQLLESEIKIRNKSMEEFPFSDFTSKASNKHCKWHDRLPWQIIASSNNYSVENLSSRIWNAQSTSKNEPVFGHSKKRNNEFGVTGAYNGFLIDKPLGRIVVDSSYHHWINMNIQSIFNKYIQDNEYQGQNNHTFNNDENTTHRFEHENTARKVYNYYSNIALWLAPWEKQQEMALMALWGALERHPLSEALPDPGAQNLNNLLKFGQQTINLLREFIGETHIRSWPIYLQNSSEEAFRLFNERNISPEYRLEVLDECLLGGVVRYFKERYLKKPLTVGQGVTVSDLRRWAKTGLNQAEYTFRKEYLRNIKEDISKMSERF